jgi:hypothetical protein
MRKTALIIFICLVGAFLNVYINALFFKVMFLPLYLDTILTITVTLLFGPVWGCITGAISNIIGETIFFWGWQGYLFTLCNVATALVTWLFMRLFPGELRFAGSQKPLPGSSRLSEAMNKMVILILLSFALCIAMSILGGTISALIEIFNSSGESAVNPAVPPIVTFFKSETPALIREILSRIPINIIDRLISAFAGYGIAFCLAMLFKKSSLINDK